MSGTVKVKVCDGWAVYDGTAQRTGGETVEVEADIAAKWVEAGWVEPTTTTTSRKRK